MKLTTIAIALVAIAGSASATIKIGQTADFSSVAGQQMKDFNLGANAYFDSVNKKGGIRGEEIKLISIDDGFVAGRARGNASKLITDENVVALFGSRGTDQSEAVMEVAEKSGVALVAPITGADSVLSSPVVFPVRAPYRAEVDEMLKLAVIMGPKLAVLVQDDKFGNPLYSYIEAELKKYKGMSIESKIVFDRKNTEMSDEARKALDSGALSVIALCNPTSSAAFFRQITEQAKAREVIRPYVFQTSIVDMYAQHADLQGKVVVVGNPYTQVFPDPHSSMLKISREFQYAMEAAGAPVNYRSYEGYLSAKVMTEGLSRAKSFSRQKVMESFNSLGEFDMGGLSVDYKPTLHNGSRFVEIASISKKGKLIR